MRTTALLLAAAAFGQCFGRPGTEPPQPEPNTGSIAVVTAGGANELFTPSAQSPTGRWFLSVADATTPDAENGLIRYVDLGADVQPLAVGADGSEVVVVDADFPRIVLVDATTTRVEAIVDLPADLSTFKVSDNEVFSTGIAVDAGRRRAWTSTTAGVFEIDLDAHVVTTTYVSPPSENFAYDPNSRMLYLPFYLCDPTSGVCNSATLPGGSDITDGLTVVDLASGVSYELVDPTAADSRAPLGKEVDAIALDMSLGVAMIATENPPALVVLEQGAAVFDRGTLTCRIPVRLTVPLTSAQTMVTADSRTHLGIAAQEVGNQLAIVDLALARTGTARVLGLAMPDLPDGDPWMSGADPHGLTVAVVRGKPYAFLVNIERTWIARIDLEQVAALQTPDLAAFADTVSYFLVPVPKGRGG